MEEDKYQIVGFWNDMGFIPDSVNPIFKGPDNYLYWAFTIINEEGKDKIPRYKNFYLFPEKFMGKVKFLEDINVILDIEQEYYGIGDEAVYCYQLEKNKAYVGSLNKYLDFITSYREYIKKSYNNGDKEAVLGSLQDEIEYLTELTKTGEMKIDK